MVYSLLSFSHHSEISVLNCLKPWVSVLLLLKSPSLFPSCLVLSLYHTGNFWEVLCNLNLMHCSIGFLKRQLYKFNINAYSL